MTINHVQYYYKMCINCLQKLVENAKEIESELKETDCCECCLDYGNFCISVYRYMKII